MTQENFKILELAGGYIALVDSEDFEQVSKFSWCAIKQGQNQVRVMTKDQHGKTLYLHRFILQDQKSVIDHINGHALDNRKSNLRLCSQQQNTFNSRIPRSNTSGYKGVSFRKDCHKYSAYIVKDRKQYYLGAFKTKEDAARAYNNKAIELYGEFARLNYVNT